ncbi:MAG: universal stress protein, partial [Chloroflexi bacterium]|nr:universal stress protein [Chloroflexota bacterium]
VLVPLDGSELAECVLPHVETVVQGCGVASVAFVRVAEPVRLPVSDDEYGFYSARLWEQMESASKAAARKYLDQLVSKVKYGGINVQTEVLTGGQAAEMIAEYATQNGFDLIIIATHGRSGISRWVWGSVADRILRSSSVPILMVRAPGCPSAS